MAYISCAYHVCKRRRGRKRERQSVRQTEREGVRERGREGGREKVPAVAACGHS